MSAVLALAALYGSWGTVVFVICMLQVGCGRGSARLCGYLSVKGTSRTVMPLRDKKGFERAKAIMKYTDSESNELMIGVFYVHSPFHMFELGKPWVMLQVAAHCAGAFQVYCPVGRKAHDA